MVQIQILINSDKIRTPLRPGMLTLFWSMWYESQEPRIMGRRLSDEKAKKANTEQIVAKLRDTDVMLNSGKDIAAVLQNMEICEAAYKRWRTQYGGMKSDEAKRLKELEIDNSRLKRLLADAELDKAMLKEALRGNG